MRTAIGNSLSYNTIIQAITDTRVRSTAIQIYSEHIMKIKEEKNRQNGKKDRARQARKRKRKRAKKNRMANNME